MGSGEMRGTWWRLRQVRRHLGGKGNETLILCRQARTDGGGDRPVGGGFMAVAAKERQGLCWRRMPRRAQSARHAAPRQQPVAPKMHAMKHMPKMHASPCACNCRVRTQCSPRAWVQHHGLAPVYEPGLSCTRATIRVMRAADAEEPRPTCFTTSICCVGTGATSMFTNLARGSENSAAQRLSPWRKGTRRRERRATSPESARARARAAAASAQPQSEARAKSPQRPPAPLCAVRFAAAGVRAL